MKKNKPLMGLYILMGSGKTFCYLFVYATLYHSITTQHSKRFSFNSMI